MSRCAACPLRCRTSICYAHRSGEPPCPLTPGCSTSTLPADEVAALCPLLDRGERARARCGSALRAIVIDSLRDAGGCGICSAAISAGEQHDTSSSALNDFRRKAADPRRRWAAVQPVAFAWRGALRTEVGIARSAATSNGGMRQLACRETADRTDLCARRASIYDRLAPAWPMDRGLLRIAGPAKGGMLVKALRQRAVLSARELRCFRSAPGEPAAAAARHRVNWSVWTLLPPSTASRPRSLSKASIRRAFKGTHPARRARQRDRLVDQ